MYGRAGIVSDRVIGRRVAVGRKHEVGACRTGRVPIVARVPDHDDRCRANAEPCSGAANGPDIRLLRREGIAADDHCDLSGDAGLVEQLLREALALVRDAGELNAMTSKRGQRPGHAGIKSAVDEKPRPVAPLESFERGVENGSLRIIAEPMRQPATNQLLDSIADPVSCRERIGPGEADGFDGLAKTMPEIGRRIDERAVEIERRQLDVLQNTRTAISAGAASSFSSSSSSFSSVSEAPAISSEVQYSPT